jgi:hypothetical protein
MMYSTKTMKLSDVCEIQTGYTARTKMEPSLKGGVPAVQLRDLSAEEDFDPAGVAHYELGLSFERYWAKPGDVLFRSRGERNTATNVASSSGAAAIAILPLMVLRPDTALVIGEYLTWYINQPPTQGYFDKCARGTGLRMIPKACIDDLDVPVPDLSTQRLIAEVDRLTRREATLLASLAEKKKEFTSFVLLEQVRKAQLHGNGAGRLVARARRKQAGKAERTNQ